jgi:hypothetical protein
MITQVTALIPHRSLPHGRTRPTIVAAGDGEENRHEVVVDPGLLTPLMSMGPKANAKLDFM